MFNIFIDDISDIFDGSCDPVKVDDIGLNHHLYADDLILLSNSSNGLQNSLSKLDTFCETWQLNVKVQKSKIMVFSPLGRVPKNFYFKIKGQDMEIVQKFCYLGITISSTGSFHYTKKNLHDKGAKALFPLVSTIKTFDLPPMLSLALFRQLISPILTYGCEIWGSYTQHQLRSMELDKCFISEYAVDNEIENVHLKFCKMLLGVKRNCSSLAVLGDLGKISVTMNTLTRIVTYWHRLAPTVL